MNYHDITTDDRKNGDGLRTVLWTAGCGHACKGCQNPITWDVNGGILFDEATEVELFEKLDKPYISGITFSGGDPLHPQNRETVGRLIRKFRDTFGNKKTIWLYTGYLWEDIKELPYVKEIDVLVDGPFCLEQRDIDLHWKGSSNQRVIDVKESLKTDSVVLHA